MQSFAKSPGVLGFGRVQGLQGAAQVGLPLGQVCVPGGLVRGQAGQPGGPGGQGGGQPAAGLVLGQGPAPGRELGQGGVPGPDLLPGSEGGHRGPTQGLQALGGPQAPGHRFGQAGGRPQGQGAPGLAALRGDARRVPLVKGLQLGLEVALAAAYFLQQQVEVPFLEPGHQLVKELGMAGGDANQFPGLLRFHGKAVVPGQFQRQAKGVPGFQAPGQGQAMPAGFQGQVGPQGEQGRRLAGQAGQEALRQTPALFFDQGLQVVQHEKGGMPGRVVQERVQGGFPPGVVGQVQGRGQVLQQPPGGGALRGFGPGHAAGEAPGVAVRSLQSQAALAQAGSAGNHHHRGGAGQGFGDSDQFPPAPEEAGLNPGHGLGPIQVVRGQAVLHHRLSRAQQVQEVHPLLAGKQGLVGGQVAIGPRQGPFQGVAVGQFGQQGAGKGHGFLVLHRQRMAHYRAGQPVLHQGPGHGLGFGRGLTSVENHQVQGLLEFQDVQELGDGYEIRPAPFVFQEQALGAGVAGEVQDVGEGALPEDPGREGAAQGVPGGRAQAAEVDGGLRRLYGPDQAGPFALQIQGDGRRLTLRGRGHGGGQQGQDAQGLGWGGRHRTSSGGSSSKAAARCRPPETLECGGSTPLSVPKRHPGPALQKRCWRRSIAAHLPAHSQIRRFAHSLIRPFIRFQSSAQAPHFKRFYRGFEVGRS